MSLDQIVARDTYIDGLRALMLETLPHVRDEALVTRIVDYMALDPRHADLLVARLSKRDTIPAPCLGDDDGSDPTVLLNGAIRHLPIGLDEDEPSRDDVIYASEEV